MNKISISVIFLILIQAIFFNFSVVADPGIVSERDYIISDDIDYVVYNESDGSYLVLSLTRRIMLLKYGRMFSYSLMLFVLCYL